MSDRIELIQTSLDRDQVEQSGVVTAASAAEPLRVDGGPRDGVDESTRGETALPTKEG